MFVAVARLTLQIPDSGSLKGKRQVLRRVTDRVKAKFNASVAEVDDQDLWQKATLALAVVGSDRRHVTEQIDKIIHFVDEQYVAPITQRETEILSFGEDLFGDEERPGVPTISSGQRSLAEAEGLGEWEKRHEARPSLPRPESGKAGKGEVKGGGRKDKLSLEEARARARELRNLRDWEKKR
jgi:uncharacterized protein